MRSYPFDSLVKSLRIDIVLGIDSNRFIPSLAESASITCERLVCRSVVRVVVKLCLLPGRRLYLPCTSQVRVYYRLCGGVRLWLRHGFQCCPTLLGHITAS